MKFTFLKDFCIWRESGTTLLGQDGLDQGGLGHLAWPGPQDGLGQGGPRLKWAKGRFGSKNDEKVKVLRMEFSIVENLSGLQESIFNLSRGPQLHFGEKSKNWSKFIKNPDFPNFPLFSPLLGATVPTPVKCLVSVVRPCMGISWCYVLLECKQPD